MAQFGADPQLVAQCPRASTPNGWQPWTDAFGPVPNDLAQRAKVFAADVAIPLGSTESFRLPDVTALIRVEPHTWTRDDAGTHQQGCFRVGAIYLPADDPKETVIAPAAPPPDKLGKTIGVLTVVSLVVGTAATLSSWVRK